MFLKGHFWHVIFVFRSVCVEDTLDVAEWISCPPLLLKYSSSTQIHNTHLSLKYSSIIEVQLYYSPLGPRWSYGGEIPRFPPLPPPIHSTAPRTQPLLWHLPATPHIQLLPIHLTATKHLLTQRPYNLQCKVQCCSLFTLFSAAM